MDKQALYAVVREAVAADPTETPELILRALTDGQRDAYQALKERASRLDWAWMGALGMLVEGVTPGTRRIMAITLQQLLESSPHMSPLEREALALLTKEAT
jgi:hypothetical protein